MDVTPVAQAVQDADPILLIIGAVALALLLMLIVVKVVRGRRRRRELAKRYGSEYARTVRQAGSRRRAHQELMDREERRRGFEVRVLGPAERERFRARLEAAQTSFVDGPEAAVRAAEELVDEVATAKGYPEAERDQRLQDIAVDHPAAVAQHREARRARDRDARRPPTTEALRESLLATRGLAEMLIGREGSHGPDSPPSFADLVEEEAPPPPTSPPVAEEVDRPAPPSRPAWVHGPAPSLYGPEGRPISGKEPRRP